MIQDWERVCRRLREHFRKQRRPVGTFDGGVKIVLFPWWDDEAGALDCALIRRPGPTVYVHETDALAERLLGKDVISGVRRMIGPGAIVYAMSRERTPRDLTRVRFAEPDVVRWFNARGLAAGIGQQDGGVISGRGLRLVREF